MTSPDDEGYFTDIGIVPVPSGPHGTNPSQSHDWIKAVTKNPKLRVEPQRHGNPCIG